MFNLKSPMSIRVSRWLSALLAVGTLLGPRQMFKVDFQLWNLRVRRVLLVALVAPLLSIMPSAPVAIAGVTTITAPQTITATAGPGVITLGWAAPATGSGSVTNYRVDYSTNGSSWTTATSSIASSDRTYTINGLTAGTSYYVRMAALFSGGTGPFGYPWTALYATTTQSRNGNAITYSPNLGLSTTAGTQASKTLASASFTRVRYRMQYEDSGVKYINTDFNRWSQKTLNQYSSGVTYTTPAATINNLSIPSLDNQFIIQVDVSDLTVESNITSMNDNQLNGRLEIWPFDYDPSVNTTLSGTNGTYYDLNDRPSSNTSSSYGSFQVHDLSNSRTAFAWNNHGNATPNIGIGSSNCGNNQLDWTFCGTTRTNWKLEIFINTPVAVTGYELTFNANSATSGSVPASIIGTGNQIVPTNSGNLVRTGYSFAGWNTAANGTGTTYNAGSTLNLSANTVLYAQWVTTLTYNKNGNTTSSALVPETQTARLSPVTNTLSTAVGLGRDGYTFGGWNTAANGSGTSYPSTNTSLAGLPTPFLRLEARNYNPSTKQWVATNGASISASNVRGSPTVVTSASAGNTSETFPVVKGERSAGIILTAASITDYTFCAVARIPTTQTFGAANGGRLFDGIGVNWLSGWWAGNQNQFFHSGWISNPSTANDTNFHLVCDRHNDVRWDGSGTGTTGGGITYLPRISISFGDYTHNVSTPSELKESSPWEVAEVLVYNSRLDDASVLQIEGYLKHRYGLTAASSLVAAPTAFSNYLTDSATTLFAQWNSTISYMSNGHSSGTVPTSSFLPQSGGNLASNSGNLVRSGFSLVGWNTQSDLTGTRYPLGSIFVPTGNQTLNAHWVSSIAFPQITYNPTTLSIGAGVGGRSDTFTATGGFGNKTFTFSPVRSGFSIDTSTANGVALVVSPVVASGTYIETITATDAAGFSVNHVVTVTVATSVRFDTSTATSLVTTYGRSASLRLNTTGGVGTRVFTMAAQSNSAITLDTSTAGSGYATLNVAASSKQGSYTISLTVTDSTRIRSGLTVVVTVNPLPVITYPTGVVPTLRTNNLVIHYDIRNSLSYSGTGSTVTDLAGGSNATIINNAAYSSEFGGSLNVGSGNYIGTNSCLASIATGAYSNFLWINPRGNGIVLTENNGGWHTSTIEVNGSTFRFRVYAGTILSHTFPSLNRWYYVGLVYDGTNQYAYVNGVQVATSAVTRSATTANCLGIGRSDATNLGVATSGEFLFGALHSYSAALSASDVANNFDATQRSYLVVTPKSGSLSIETTQGLNTSFSNFTGSDGTRIKNFGLTPTITGITIETGTANSAVLRIGPTATATSSTVAAIYAETLTAIDEVGASTKYDLSIKINPPIAITASTPITLNMTSGRTAYDTFTATYGTGTKTFTGLSSAFASAFALTSPSTNVAVLTVAANLPAGTYVETITATDSVGATATYVLTVVVNPAMIVAGASGNSVATTVGRSATLRVNVTGGTSTRTLATTNVTAGISIDSSTITSNFVTLNVGTTLNAGTYSFVITATDLVGATARETFTVTVNALPTISTSSTTITTTQGVSSTLAGSTSLGGTGNKTFMITGGNIGVSIETSTVNAYSLSIANTASATNSTTARIFTETVTAMDSAGAVVRQAYAITINPPIRVESTTSTITTTSGIVAWDTFTATFGTGNYTFTLAGTPNTNGLTLTQTNNRAVLRVGSTVNPGTYTLTITVTDAVGAVTTVAKTVVVNNLPTISGNANVAGTTGYAFSSQAYSAANGTGTLSFSLTTSPSAAGIALSGSTGSPTINISSSVAADTYTVTLRVTDSVTAVGTFVITLRVNPIATLSGTRTLTKVYGEDLSQVYTTSGGTAPFNLASSSVCTSEKLTYVGNGSNGLLGTAYTVEVFNGLTTCNWVAPTSVTLADVLVVAGGGGGGSRHAGGGGGGGVMYATNYSLAPGSSYSLSVGDGGAGIISGNGSTGQNSFFGGSTGGTSIVANGGGGSSANGGSGGGSNYQAAAAGSATPGSTTGTSRSAGSSTMTINGVVAQVTAYGQSGAVGQGDGLCKPFNTSTARGWCGGGGGGASSAGTTPAVNSSPQWRAGNGGNGVALSITGSSVTYAGGGGGGAGSDSSYTTTADCAADAPREGYGGTGGGGNGSKCLLQATNGTNGLGGGGGGGGYGYYSFTTNQNAQSGAGGSGTVIVRYVTPAIETQSARITMDTLGSSPGIIRLNAPRLLAVGSYTQTVSAKDSAATPVTTSATITLTVTKATPTLTLALPGSVTTAKYGNPVTISAVATTPGTVAFVNGSTNITACTAVATTAGLATCSWTPTVVGSTTLRATLTPTDTANYNSSAQVNLPVTVAKADTLTVTVSSLTRQYTGSAVSVTGAFTTTGLVAIDSLTAISMLYSGTANTGTFRSATTAPTDAGIYSITPNFPANANAYTFAAGSLGTTSAVSNYESVTVVAGTLTVNRAPQVLSFTYPNTNTATYSPTGTITPTAITRLDSATPTFSSSTLSKCTIDSATAVISIVEAGSCQVAMATAQTFNYLAETATSTVTINKASRTFSLTPAVSTLKYAESTTVTATLSGGSADGAISYTLGSPAGCTFDPLTGELVAISGTIQCPLTATISEGTNYLAETATAISLTIARANAPIIIIDTVTAVSHIPSTRAAISPTFTVSGLKYSDTAGSLTFTYSFVSNPFETFAYSDTRTPIDAGTYRITPSALTLSTGLLSNYETPTYSSSAINFTINRINQESITVINTNGEVEVPFTLRTSGGSTGGALTFTKVSGDFCLVSSSSLTATAAGLCLITVTMAGNRNFMSVTSETITVRVRNFVRVIFEAPSNTTTGISIAPTTPLTKGDNACTSGCVPTLTRADIYDVAEGDLIILTGTNLLTVTKVYFNIYIEAPNFTANSDTELAVRVPADLPQGDATIEVISPGGTSNRLFDFVILP